MAFKSIYWQIFITLEAKIELSKFPYPIQFLNQEFSDNNTIIVLIAIYGNEYILEKLSILRAKSIVNDVIPICGKKIKHKHPIKSVFLSWPFYPNWKCITYLPGTVLVFVRNLSPNKLPIKCQNQWKIIVGHMPSLIHGHSVVDLCVLILRDPWF